MAKKVYPAWHYYVAAAIALAFGISQLALQSWLYGGVATAVGAVLAVVGWTKRKPKAAESVGGA